MTTLLYTHPVCTKHDLGPGHPECPARLQSVTAALAGEAFSTLERREAPRADRAQIARVHDPRYIEEVLDAVPETGFVPLNPDTGLSPHSGEAALAAVGAVTEAVDRVIAGDARNAFCAVRPPGHHAEHDRAMGFCLFNNIAIGAFHARAVHDLNRVAVIDFDVHHGNGTQHSFENEKGLFYASSHEFPNYPGTGQREETGAYGTIVNVPLPPGTGGADFRAAYEREILPALEDFAPELVMISAGFDGHDRDPLSQMRLLEDDFAWVTRRLLDVADKTAGGRVISVLEGGYDLAALGASVALHVRVLMDGN